MGMEQMLQTMAQQMLNSNPLFQRAAQMAHGKNEQEIAQIAENLCKQRGLDINQMYQQFQNQMQSMLSGQNQNKV